MRITHVINTDHFAGLERYVVDVSAELARRGHNVRVAGGQPAKMRALLPSSVSWEPGAGAAESLRALRRGGRRDIVHSHITKADFVSLAAAPFTRARRVSTRHIPAHRGYSRAAKVLAPVVRARLAVEIAVSEWTSTQLERPSDTVLLNGVPRVPDATGAREPIVFVAQRLEAEKDTACALRAWAQAALAADGWRMVIAGRGPLRESLEDLRDELGVRDSVEFVGFIDDPERLYATASMLLAAPPTEPCGLTVLEAMSWGLPVVAAGSGGNPETVGRSANAALFPPGDAAAAAAHLRRLADDDAARTAYGLELRQLQRARYEVSIHVDGLEEIYRRALQ